MKTDAKILVVDDMASLTEMLRNILYELGYFEVTTCSSALDAKQKYMEAIDRGIPFSLILSDINMPEEDGISFLKWIRATSNVPVIMVSAMGDLDNVMSAAESGANSFIVKPVTLEKVKAKIEKI